MYGELNDLIIKVGEKKKNFLKGSFLKYFVSAMLAGVYVGLGILLIFTIGGLMQDNPANKVVMGLSFGIALSLVMMLGAELFTGNNMIGFGALLNKVINVKEIGKLWFFSYFGNLFGSIILSIIYVYSASGNEKIINFMIKASQAKIAPTATQLFLKGLLCNILVCLAVMSAIKLKDESAKLIMIFWCLFAFITTGYEHSVANMTLLTVGYLVKGISIGGYIYNLLFVTLGNIVGGCILGAAYYLLRKED